MAKRQKEVHCDIYDQSRVIYVYADDVVIEHVRKMEPVTDVQPGVPGSQVVSVDPRYNIDQVARDIVVLAKDLAHYPSMSSIFTFLFKT